MLKIVLINDLEEDFLNLIRPYCKYAICKDKKESVLKNYEYKLNFNTVKEELCFSKKLNDFKKINDNLKKELYKI